MELAEILKGLPLGGLKYYDSIGSTNDAAADWALHDAPDLALVVADEQTAGRGRHGRSWHTPAGAALAFSLVLHPSGKGDLSSILPRLNALGALAICQALNELFSMEACIKWPNDVLVSNRKAAGVLAEAHWQGDQLQAVILGIGLNVSKQANPRENRLSYPATSIEGEFGQIVDRWDLLKEILMRLLAWKDRVESDEFFRAWEGLLAYRGEWVSVEDGSRIVQGRLLGLNADGSLRLMDRANAVLSISTGAGSLRLLPG